MIPFTNINTLNGRTSPRVFAETTRVGRGSTRGNPRKPAASRCLFSAKAQIYDMSTIATPAAVDLSALARATGPGRVSEMAGGLVASEILRIAAEIRGLVRGGKTICNLTVGDFDPKQFPIPCLLRTGITKALEGGETNYPPSDGVPELRQAVQRYYQRELGLNYPVESILIAAGARPLIYAIYRAVVDAGDRVLYPLPSWNNVHYIHMVGAHGVPIPCTGANRFLPTLEQLAPELPAARLLSLNSPLNPTGTAIDPEVLRGICEAVVAENTRRQKTGARPLYMMYDHIYWPLCVGAAKHATPPELVPEMARYTIFVDGISKAFAATGVRVGWSVGPVDVIERMSAINGHVGAWAPRAEQFATAALLDDPAACTAYNEVFIAGIRRRLDAASTALGAMKAKGLPVDVIPPMGAIYLSARIHPFGKRTPDGKVLNTNEEVRAWILAAARIGVVPFQAFGVPEDSGWFRLSVGAASEQEIAAAMPRLEAALGTLT
jgi:aspartate aminotransferase